MSHDAQVSVVIRTDGELRPFLLVHGLSSNAHLWDGVATRLAMKGHPSAAVDQRGHGRSHETGGDLDFKTLTEDLATVIDTALPSPVIAAGQSWGGNIVLELAARHGHLLAGLVLIDGGFLRLRDGFQDWEEARTALTPPSFDGLTADELESRMRRRMVNWPGEAVAGQLANFTTEDGRVRPRLELSRHLRVLEHLWNHDPDRAAAEVEIPILVIAVGDRAAKRARVSAFERASGAHIEWLEGDHDIHAEQPDVVARLLAEFAEGLEP